MQIEAIEVPELGEKFGFHDLSGVLQRLGVRTLMLGERELIPEAEWHRVVREALEGSTASVAREPGVVPGLALGDWGWRREGLLQAHPWLKELSDGFVAHVRQQVPEASVKQNAQTVTFTMPGGGRAGLRLRKQGLLLAARRQGDEKTHWVKRKEDFAEALNWLLNLPDY